MYISVLDFIVIPKSEGLYSTILRKAEQKQMNAVATHHINMYQSFSSFVKQS